MLCIKDKINIKSFKLMKEKHPLHSLAIDYLGIFVPVKFVINDSTEVFVLINPFHFVVINKQVRELQYCDENLQSSPWFS